jgi:hypothetical protein
MRSAAHSPPTPLLAGHSRAAVTKMKLILNLAQRIGAKRDRQATLGPDKAASKRAKQSIGYFTHSRLSKLAAEDSSRAGRGRREEFVREQKARCLNSSMCVLSISCK